MQIMATKPPWVEQQVNVRVIGSAGVGKATFVEFLHKLIALTRAYLDMHKVCHMQGVRQWKRRMVNISVSEFVGSEAAEATGGGDPAPAGGDIQLVFLLLDICDAASFQALQAQRSQIAALPATAGLFLLGNKQDLDYWRRVPLPVVRSFSAEVGATYQELSLHSGHLLAEVASTVLSAAYQDSGLDLSALTDGLLRDLRGDLWGAGAEVSDSSDSGGGYSDEGGGDGEVSDDEERREEGDELQGVPYRFVGEENEKEKSLDGELWDVSPGSPLDLEDDGVPAPVASSSSSRPGAPPAPSGSPALRFPALPPSALPPPTSASGALTGLLNKTEKKKKSSRSLARPQSNEMEKKLQKRFIPTRRKILDDELQSVKAQEAMWRKEVEEGQPECNDLFEEQQKSLEDSLDGLATRLLEAELNVIKDGLTKVLDQEPSRVEGLDSLSESIDTSADELLHQSKKVFKSARKQKLKGLSGCIICLQSAEKCMQSLEECVQGSCEATDKCFRYLRARLALKNKLFDNVLADTENAFQTLAKFLCFFHQQCCSDDGCYHILESVLYEPITYAMSISLIVSSSLALILPSFFTLLVVRTTTTEKESTNFGVRQEVIRHEKPEQSFVRWVRIIVRSAPMTFFLLVMPYLLVYRVFPKSTDKEIVQYLFGYIFAVIVLQCLGTVRAFYSWKDRDASLPPKPPPLYKKKEEKKKKKDGMKKLKTTTTTSTTTTSSSSSSSSNSNNDKKRGRALSDGDGATGEGLELIAIDMHRSDSDRGDSSGKQRIAKRKKSCYAVCCKFTDESKDMQNEELIEKPGEEQLKGGCCTACCPAFVSKQLSCCSWWALPTEAEKEEPPKPAPVPEAPNSFSLSANALVLASLALEFFQMASFPLQNNPYQSNDADSSMPTFAPTLAPTGAKTAVAAEDAAEQFWGRTVFKALYVSIGANVQEIIMWCTIGAVGLLLLIFAIQFFTELFKYGKLLRRVEDKDEAKDVFFFSFTGAIVYGHGNPKYVSDNFRTVVALMTDGLFLVISMRLLTVLSCDYSDPSSPATLYADPSIVCWEGKHMPLAAAALTSYSFYVPLSIMIAPMLLEAAPTDAEHPAVEGVSYMKLYVMVINIVKSVMLVVGTLGPHTVVAVVTSTTVTSLVLGLVTIVWFVRTAEKKEKQQGVERNRVYADDVQPCNKAFINSWKAASYAAAVASALVIVTAHELGEQKFPQTSLIPVLCTVWVLVILLFVALHFWWLGKNTERRRHTEELVNEPFVWRDAKEQQTGKGLDSDLSYWHPDFQAQSLQTQKNALREQDEHVGITSHEENASPLLQEDSSSSSSRANTDAYLSMSRTQAARFFVSGINDQLKDATKLQSMAVVAALLLRYHSTQSLATLSAYMSEGGQGKQGSAKPSTVDFAESNENLRKKIDALTLYYKVQLNLEGHQLRARMLLDGYGREFANLVVNTKSTS